MLTDPENYSYDYTKQLIESIQDIETQRWACLLYGTGARVSEAKGIRVCDVTFQDKVDGNKYLVIRCPVFKKHDELKHFRQAPIRMDEDWLVSPILSLTRLAGEPTSTNLIVSAHRATIYRKLVLLKKLAPENAWLKKLLRENVFKGERFLERRDFDIEKFKMELNQELKKLM
jgi:hypothetical protein